MGDAGVVSDGTWLEVDELTLVDMAGRQGYEYKASGATIRPRAEGFRAHAELTRRVAVELRETCAALDSLRIETAVSGAKMVRYTRWLIVLTVIVALVGVGAVVATLVAA